MTAAILVLIAEVALFWLVFFRLKLLRLTPTWVVIFIFIMAPVFTVFLIGLRFVTPVSANATVIQHTIQLIPSLSEPTPVTAVLVEENTMVKKDQPLFRFDRRLYEYKVKQLEAELAEAKQNVKVLKTDTEISQQKVTRLTADLTFEQQQQAMYDRLAQAHAAPREDVQKYVARVTGAQASVLEALAELYRARLRYESEIDGVNTTVANKEAHCRRATTWRTQPWLRRRMAASSTSRSSRAWWPAPGAPAESRL